MKSVVLALQFMTRLPLPQIQADADDFARAMRWFPLAGVVVGGCVTLPWWLLSHRDPWLGALAGLAGWVAITGALHLDGLGDVADGAGAAHADKTRLSEALRDPHVGSFAVTTITLQLLAKLVLLRALDPMDGVALLLVPVFARIAPMAWALFLPPLHTGLGSRFRAGINRTHLAGWSVAALILAFITSLPLIAALLAVPLWGVWLRKRIGGISGDGHGAGIEVVETALLLALVLAR